jgi:hypothetical protein
MAQIRPVRSITSQAQRVGNQPPPGFQNGYLYLVDEHATVRAFSPAGLAVPTTVFEIPDAQDVWAEGFAVDTDGTFAVGVSSQRARAGGITFYDRYGQPDGFVATGSYLPKSLGILSVTRVRADGVPS